MPSYARNMKAPDSPATPAVTGIMYPSPVDVPTEMESAHYRRQNYMADPSFLSQNADEFPVDDDTEPRTDKNSSLDQLWGTIRQEKERKMAKERPKVKSLEEPQHEIPGSVPDLPSIEIPVFESAGRQQMKKQKSISNMRESTDGRSIVASFDMPRGASNLHVSHSKNRLIVTWESVEVSDWEGDDGVVFRERLEKHFHRTIPLPEGTRFEEIKAAMDHRRLTLRFPNMRCFRVETRPRSEES